MEKKYCTSVQTISRLICEDKEETAHAETQMNIILSRIIIYCVSCGCDQSLRYQNSVDDSNCKEIALCKGTMIFCDRHLYGVGA